MSLPLPDPFLRGQEDGKSEGAPLRETGLQRWGVGVCFPLAHGFTRCPRCCGVARCRGFRRLPGFAAQEHRLPSLVGGPLLATSFTRVFRSSTWLPGLAVTAPCISIPLSCRPTGPWSEFPSVASHVYNQGTKLGDIRTVTAVVACLAGGTVVRCHPLHPKGPSLTWAVLASPCFSFARWVSSHRHSFPLFPTLLLQRLQNS